MSIIDDVTGELGKLAGAAQSKAASTTSSAQGKVAQVASSVSSAVARKVAPAELTTEELVATLTRKALIAGIGFAFSKLKLPAALQAPIVTTVVPMLLLAEHALTSRIAAKKAVAG